MDRASRADRGAHRDAREPGNADPLRARGSDPIDRHVGKGQHADRLGHRFADRADLLVGADPWREQHVGAGLLIGLQAPDRVVEVRVAPEVILGTAREREREVERPSRLRGGGDTRCGALGLVEEAAAVPVLDRAADRARLGDPDDRKGGVRGLGAVAVFEVHGDGQVGRPVERPRVLGRLVEADLAVRPSQREREPAARARERLEAQLREGPGRPRVPGVRRHEGLPW